LFPEFGKFDQAFDGSPVAAVADDAGPPLRKRKTWNQKLVFWGANLAAIPLIGLIYATVIAEGLRRLLPVFQMRLYNLPIPGAGIARNYDGWNRLDLALLMSLLLFAVVSWLWYRVFTELLGFGTIWARRHSAPVVAYLLTGITVVLIGLSSQTASGWSETPEYVAPAATIIYACGLAVLGWAHSDYHHSGTV